MEPFGAKITKNAPFTPKSLFGPKSEFWVQNTLFAQKVIFGRKVRFRAKSAILSLHQLTYTLSELRPAPPDPILARFYTQNVHFGHFVQNCLLRILSKNQR